MSGRNDESGWSLAKTAVLLAIAVALLGWAFAAAGYANAAEGWTATGSPAPGTPEAEAMAEAGEDLGGGGISRRGRRRGLASFLINAVVQIPAAPQVIGFTFRERPWLLAVVVVLEGVLVGGACLLRKLDAELHGKPGANRRR
ncbi:MAG: hypothetical protein AAF907_09460 [Planctomycetota bacterium]